MKSITSQSTAQSVSRTRPSWMQRLVLGQMERISSGSLTLKAGGETHHFGASVSGSPTATIEVHDEQFWSAIATRGSIGAGEAYARSWWTSPDPVAVVRLFVRNHDALQGLEGGLALLAKPAFGLYHALRSNNAANAKRNIRAHYDV